MVMASKTARFYHPLDRPRPTVRPSVRPPVPLRPPTRLPFCQQQIVMAVNLVPLPRALSPSLPLTLSSKPIWVAWTSVCPSGDLDSRSLSGRECLND